MVAAALTAEFEGHETFNCAAPDNALGRPLVERFEEHYGETPEDCAVEGEDSAYSTATAARLLDWEPTRSWRDAAATDVSVPTV